MAFPQSTMALSRLLEVEQTNEDKLPWDDQYIYNV